MAVKVQFEIGHTSKLRAKKTAEGFTHDWELYVKGVGKAEIKVFVEKVVFTLHASFTKPKRAIKEPPYLIQESGYAGFILPIDIYFRNKEEPKRVQFSYDLDLQQTGPPHHRFEVKKFIFENPTEEFRQKLIKGGGVPVAGVVGRSVLPAIKPPSSIVPELESRPMPFGDSSTLSSKQKITSNEAKKHKPRHKDDKTNSFANLFGAPIQTNPNEPKHLLENSANRSNSAAALNEKFSKDKEYSTEKSREKVDRNDINKAMLHKAMLNKVKSSTGKSEKTSEGEKSKYKVHDKERGKREKAENMNSQSILPKHSPLKSESTASGHADDFKKEQIENIKQNDKKSKKEKKDKDRKREGNDEKQFNLDRRIDTDAHRSEKLINRDASSSPLPKMGIGNNDMAEKKMVTNKEKKNSMQDKTKSNKEDKPHKYKKKVKSKDIDREKVNDKNRKTDKKSSSSFKEISRHDQMSSLPETSTKTHKFDRGVYEKMQRKDKSNIKSSNKVSNSDEKRKNNELSVDNNSVEKNDKYESMPSFPKNPSSNHSSLSAGLQVSEESSSSSLQETMTKNVYKKSPKNVGEQIKTSTHKNQSERDERREDKKHRFAAINNDTAKLSFLEPPTKRKREQNTKSPESYPSTLSNVSIPQSTYHRTNLSGLPAEYMIELQELHKKIISLQDEELQQVVELVASTGCYEITTKTFDFDLCRLNQNIVQRLQQLISNSAV